MKNFFKKAKAYWRGDDIANDYQAQRLENILRMRRGVLTFQVFIALIVVILCYFAYLKFIDTNIPAVYNNLPFPVVTPEIEPGGKLVYLSDFCRLDDSPVSFQTEWINLDTNGWEAGESFFDVVGEPGCKQLLVSFSAPNDLVPGTYVLEIDITYQTNWLNKRTIVLRTDEFRVISN